jgi:glucose/arabinose dehydrogenase
MERGSRAAYAIVLLLILGGMSSGAAQGPLLPAPGEPLVLQTNTGRVRVVLVAEGLVHPWSIAFLPGENTMFVTERTGRLRIIRNGCSILIQSGKCRRTSARRTASAPW